VTAVHSRADWGARPPDPARLTVRTPAELNGSLGATIHHTGYGGTLFHPDPYARLRGIQAYHMDTLGYGDIAYNGAFDADGNVFQCRDGKYVGAHAYGSKRGANTPNELTEGYVFLEDERALTDAAVVALAWLCDLYAFVHGGRRPHLFAHEYWSITECPGGYLENAVRFLHGSV